MLEKNTRRLYLSYFDRSLSRRVRRLPKALAVDSPTTLEVEEACRRLGLAYTTLPSAAHPAAWWTSQGAIELETPAKYRAMKLIAQQIRLLREEKRGQKYGDRNP